EQARGGGPDPDRCRRLRDERNSGQRGCSRPHRDRHDRRGARRRHGGNRRQDHPTAYGTAEGDRGCGRLAVLGVRFVCERCCSASRRRLARCVTKGNTCPEPPGSALLQAEMARRLGVSRTPMREAFRLLQEEGLIDAKPDQRARVRAVDPEDLDGVYGARIMLESLAVTATAKTLTGADLDRM